MAKDDLNQMRREYQQVLSMSEQEVFAMHEESKGKRAGTSRNKLRTLPGCKET